MSVSDAMACGQLLCVRDSRECKQAGKCQAEQETEQESQSQSELEV